MKLPSIRMVKHCAKRGVVIASGYAVAMGTIVLASKVTVPVINTLKEVVTKFIR